LFKVDEKREGALEPRVGAIKGGTPSGNFLGREKGPLREKL